MADEATFSDLILLAPKGANRCKHEFWVKSAIPTAHAELLAEELSVSTQLKCDMVFRIRSPDPMWAEVGELLADREVIFEHHSKSVSRDNFSGCIIKQASYARQKRRKGLPRGTHSPCLLITSYHFPRKMFKHSDFKCIGIPGIYVQGGSDHLIILIVTSRLPAAAKYNFLRLLSRAPDFDQLESIQEQLMEIRELTKLEREKLKEAAMTLATQSESTIRQLAKKQVALEIAVEEKQAVIDRVSEQKNAALHALSQKDQALSQKDQALSQKDQALSQKDQELAFALKEIEELKKQLSKA